MKPKLFIGSSVEGLSVAYAVQQNLDHETDATVWPQGVFELSKTAIESLDEVLEATDFGIFVFSPDDEISMKGVSSSSIRDNVLFELGLFIGKLGRGRAFFIMPDGVSIHIPTDLLGVTPGVYNAKREDGNLSAATGVACNQIRTQIKKIGNRRPVEEPSEPAKVNEEKSNIDDEWIFDLFSNDLPSARDKLKKRMQDKSGEDLIIDQAWLAYIDLKSDAVYGRDILQKISNENIEKLAVQKLIARMFSWEKYYEDAIGMVENLLVLQPETELVEILSGFYRSIGNTDKAIALLNSIEHSKNPSAVILLAEIYEERKEMETALRIVVSTYLKYPSNESLAYKCANLLMSSDKFKEALYILNSLTITDSNVASYWGNLSNTALALELYDKAMAACKKAHEISQGKEGWILHNIGNMLNNKGFYSDAILWLNNGLAVEPSSQYAHERLGSAIKNCEDEQKVFQEYCNEGMLLIRQILLTPPAPPSP